MLLTVLILLPYVVFGLTPHSILDLPEIYPNQARAGEELDFPGPGIVRVPAGGAWVENAIETGEFTVDLRVRPMSVDMDGPARILTVSLDPGTRNLTIGQRGDSLVVRLRHPGTGINGRPDVIVPHVFATAEWVDVRLSLEGTAFSIGVDGMPVEEVPVRGDALTVWSPLHKVALGNELTMDRPWLGSIQRAHLTAGSIALDLLDPANQEQPFWVVREPTPNFGHALDLIVNYLGFIPLGIVAALWIRPLRWPGVVLTVCCIGLVSVGIETIQLRLPDRSPSVLDLEMNIAGGATGLILAVLLSRWRRLVHREFASIPTNVD